MRRGVVPALVVATTALLAACSDPPDAPRGTPGLTLTLHGAATDTISARPDTLEAVLNDAKGHPVSGATVTFYVPDPGTQVAIGYVGPLAPEELQFSWPVVTDASGRARGLFRRTTRPSTGWVYAKVQSSPTVVDSVQVATTPGNAASVELHPADTMMYEGHSVAIDARVLDRFGNRREELPTLVALGGGIAVNARTITATAGPSVQRYVAKLGALADTGQVEIVPRGTIAARVMRGGEAYALARLQLDGSDYVHFAPTTSPRIIGSWERELSLQWAPDAGWLVFAEQTAPDSIALFRATPAGEITRIAFVAPSAMSLAPAISADGAWVYFSAMEPSLVESYLYRVHPDGTGLERLTFPPAIPPASDRFPSPSPDGRSVVIASSRAHGVVDLDLYVLTLATGDLTPLGVRGTAPRWSPGGDWIAFSDGQGGLDIVHPDGTGLRALVTDGTSTPAFSWAPDGKWIVAERSYGFLELIEVATGLRLPLFSTAGLGTPAWRPN